MNPSVWDWIVWQVQMFWHMLPWFVTYWKIPCQRLLCIVKFVRQSALCWIISIPRLGNERYDSPHSVGLAQMVQRCDCNGVRWTPNYLTKGRKCFWDMMLLVVFGRGFGHVETNVFLWMKGLAGLLHGRIPNYVRWDMWFSGKAIGSDVGWGSSFDGAEEPAFQKAWTL